MMPVEADDTGPRSPRRPPRHGKSPGLDEEDVEGNHQGADSPERHHLFHRR
jgi:hypothetical protein